MAIEGYHSVSLSIKPRLSMQRERMEELKLQHGRIGCELAIREAISVRRSQLHDRA